MGNNEQGTNPQEKGNQQLNIQEINNNINLDDKHEKEKKDFQKFRDIVLKYEYYNKLLKLNFTNNKILKILYEPESIFNTFYKEMFYILETIPYINYQECIKLSEKSYTLNKDDNRNNTIKTKNSLNKVRFDFSNNNINNISSMVKKKSGSISSVNSLRNSTKPILKKTDSFDISLPKPSKNIFLNNNNNYNSNLYNELIFIMEKICLYDIKKIQKILLIYPINNLRWIIWLAVAKSKYYQTQNKINISNADIYNELVNKVEVINDSLMFELHSTLKELKVFKCNWSLCLYRIIKCLLLYKKDLKYQSGMNILLGVPLLISDCKEEDTFFFARYLFSSYYGLGLCYFFGEDELLLNYLVFIVLYLTKEKFPDIHNLLTKLNIAEDLWIKKWIKTFFSSVFDLSITIRLWDCVIGVGLKFLVNYTLAIFEFFKDKILQLKKVKYFLEFFDYDLKKKYTKQKDIINFRENIIKLAQSYNIPDGKYQLIEKEYLNLLFNDMMTPKSESFDSTKTVNNYYTNNDFLNEEQYHIKLILRTLIYIPSEYLENNAEDKAIYKFKKKKTSKWLAAQKSLKKIEEMEKDSDISFLAQDLKNNSQNSLEKQSDNFKGLQIYSSKNISSNSKSSKNEEEKNNFNDHFFSSKSENNTIPLNNSNKNFNESNEEISNNDTSLDLSFHEEQLPDLIKE